MGVGTLVEGAGAATASVLLPTTNPAPEGCRLTNVPATETPGPPAEMVVPAIANAEGLGVKIWSPIVMGVGDSSGGAEAPNTNALPPTTNLAPDGCKLITVPAIVIAGPPADKGDASIAIAGRFVEGIWLAGRLIGTPDTVIAAPPGMRV